MNLNEIKYHLNEIDKLTAAMDLGDIFSYSKVKEVLRRNISKRKIGEKPKNKLRKRVKNKK